VEIIVIRMEGIDAFAGMMPAYSLACNKSHHAAAG
jgi:hypothetical protein